MSKTADEVLKYWEDKNETADFKVNEYLTMRECRIKAMEEFSSSKDKRIAELEERVELAEDIEFILRLEIEQLKKLESEKANNRIFEIAEQAHKNYGISDSHFNEIKVLTKKNQ